MNEYDPFDEMKTEGEVPEHEAADWNPDEPAAAESDAHIDSADSYSDPAAGADAPIGSAADPVMAADFSGYTPFDNEQPADNEQPIADEQPADSEQPIADEQPVYQSYYYSSGPAFTARPAQGWSAYGQTRTEQTRSAQVVQPRSQSDTQAPVSPYTVQAQTKAEKRRSGGFWKKAVALALVCCLLGGAAGFGGALLANKLQPAKTNAVNGPGSGSTVQVAAPRESTELNVITVDSGKLKTAAQVYESNVNSTVGITTEITTNVWGFQSTAAAAGSGFILTEDGYILTNEHVIENANSITVAMYDGTKYPATLIGYDVSNDIAVLKIDAKGLTPVTLGDSDALKVGDEVVAIGNPLGELTFSLTKGNVSALNRAVTLSSNVTMNLIQTDAAINSGNSGGALFNMYGEVVGITNAKYSSSGYNGEASIDNIGFAIPINSVRQIVSSIIEKGYITTPYIGVTVSNVSEESQSYGMPQGAAIRAVEQGGPAEQGGLQANDIVTAVNGKTITSYEELVTIVSGCEPGDQLNFTVYRKGETVNLTVTVGEKTQSALPDQQSGQSQSGQNGQNPNGQGQDGQNQDGQSGQGQSPWGGNGSNPWGGSGSNGSDGSDGGSGFPWGSGDPWSWFFG